MKKSMIIRAVTLFVIGTTFFGCQSSDRKVENAKENLHDAAEDLDKIQKDAVEAKKKAVSDEEWKAFKIEAQAKIDANEVRIDELKKKMKKSGKVLDEIYAQNIVVLKKQNRDLQAKIDAYDRDHSDWEAFKKDFNKAIDDMGDAIDDFADKFKK